MRLGLDIGGTKTHAVLLNDHDAVFHEARVPTMRGNAGVVRSATSAVEQLLGSAGMSLASVSSIGVGIPGVVDQRNGVVSNARNIGVHALDLGCRLQEALGKAVRIENDVNASVIGSMKTLGVRNDASIAFLNVGTGLAAGLILNGKLWRGPRGAAGEIGQILIDPSGPPDIDDQRGSLEEMASGSGIERQWGQAGPAGVRQLIEAAHRGDEKALAIRADLTRAVAASVRILVLTLDLDLVVIGGGIVDADRAVIDDVARFLRDEAASRFVRSLDLPQRIEGAPSGSPIGAIGAATLGSI